MRLNGKIAWVVGGSTGIGAAVARELVCRGATVAISARRKEQLQEVAGGDMLVLPADVTDAASVSAAAARVRQELGPIDLAVLSVLSEEDGYGYDVVRRLRAAGLDEVGDASVYGTLRRLYSAGALTSYVVPSDEGPHRKYYGINAEGRTVLETQGKTWAAFAALVERNNGIFGGCWCMGFHPEGARSASGHT